MKCVTPQIGAENEGHYTPLTGAQTEADRVRELAALIQDTWMADVVVLDAEGIARAIMAAGWVSPGAHADVIEDIHETLDDYGKAVGALNLANHRRVRVEALLQAEIADEIESRVRAARGDVRCLVCNLRHEERQEYGCQESGRGHSYDEGDLVAAERIERSGPVEHVTLSVADLRAALADPDAALAPVESETWTWTKGDVVLWCDGEVWQRGEAELWSDTDGNSLEDETVTAEMTNCRGRVLVCKARGIGTDGGAA